MPKPLNLTGVQDQHPPSPSSHLSISQHPDDPPDLFPHLLFPVSCPSDNQSQKAEQEETEAMVMWASGHYPVTRYTVRQSSSSSLSTPSPPLHLQTIHYFSTLSLSFSFNSDNLLHQHRVCEDETSNLCFNAMDSRSSNQAQSRELFHYAVSYVSVFRVFLTQAQVLVYRNTFAF